MLAGVEKLIAGWAVVLLAFVASVRRLTGPLLRPSQRPVDEGILDYVPPEDRSGLVRLGAFALGAVFTLADAVASVLAVARDVPWVLLVSVPVIAIGPVLWWWLRQDPRRR